MENKYIDQLTPRLTAAEATSELQFEAEDLGLPEPPYSRKMYGPAAVEASVNNMTAEKRFELFGFPWVEDLTELKAIEGADVRMVRMVIDGPHVWWYYVYGEDPAGADELNVVRGDDNLGNWRARLSV